MTLKLALSRPAGKDEKMGCECCNAHLKVEVHDQQVEKLCENCYVEAPNPPRAYDPWAVHSVKRTLAGNDGLEWISPLLARIVQFLREHAEARPDELAAAVGKHEPNLRREFAALRPMEIVNVTKRGPEILSTLFDTAK